MTQAEFNRSWAQYTLNPAAGGLGAGGVAVTSGVASFLSNSSGSIGIRQDIPSGVYNISLSIGGGSDATHYFLLSTSGSLIYNFSASEAGVYTIPAYINQNIELLWTGSGDSNIGELYYIRAESPQTQYSETIYTISGTISRTRYDGREDYTGELGGTRLEVTKGEQFPNPYLTFNNTYSSSNPFGLNNISYNQTFDPTGPTTSKQWTYATQQIVFPTTVQLFYNGGNTLIYYKIDNTAPNYNNLGTYSTTSPTARSFTLLNNGNIISIGSSQYLSFACTGSSFSSPREEITGISINEINNPNISIYTFSSTLINLTLL